MRNLLKINTWGAGWNTVISTAEGDVPVSASYVRWYSGDVPGRIIERGKESWGSSNCEMRFHQVKLVFDIREKNHSHIRIQYFKNGVEIMHINKPIVYLTSDGEQHTQYWTEQGESPWNVVGSELIIDPSKPQNDCLRIYFMIFEEQNIPPTDEYNSWYLLDEVPLAQVSTGGEPNESR